MIIVCLGNKVSCCGNRDDIFNEDSHKKAGINYYWNSLVLMNGLLF